MAFLTAASFRAIVSGQQRGLLAGTLRSLLSAAEPLYGAVVAQKNRRFDSGALQATKVDAPVISVGNLTVGGTGKTPLVVWLAKWFRQQGRDVTLISRGYGKRQGPNDEALEIAASLPAVPQIQNPDRIAAAREALRNSRAAVLILDDAFQHRRLARNLDIVLLDALEPFGYGHLLPRGLLREPIASLQRAQVIALSRAGAISTERRAEIRAIVAQHAPQADWLELTHAPVALIDHSGREETLTDWREKPLAAFAGIGNPAGFQFTLAQCGLQIAAWKEFADHQAYGPAEQQALANWLNAHGSLAGVICTHKDLVKLPVNSIGKLPLRALKIALQITSGQDRLENRLRELLIASAGAR
ncbi:Tetraacyldisaccharide 4'-kinase [Anatilimnocola aggregata]|uniref:Tetraacyldisaccharide 4'-kinase n=1 Tax=Anatilimnocola aggregata TaxID=2528021 RepID=A0A517YLW9_9BACT|nr:tetraacyldisaccharide 4'-kinase [Anatilimnocola aggregata]QDU31225.1 Tetraacyldisaccharide 4'-kinase [Anatilimnocola aggregata]